MPRAHIGAGSDPQGRARSVQPGGVLFEAEGKADISELPTFHGGSSADGGVVRDVPSARLFRTEFEMSRPACPHCRSQLGPGLHNTDAERDRF